MKQTCCLKKNVISFDQESHGNVLDSSIVVKESNARVRVYPQGTKATNLISRNEKIRRKFNMLKLLLQKF